MAEGKALGKNDLFESDAFSDAIKGADALLAIIRETNKEIKLSLAAQKEFVSAFKPKSFDDVKKLNNELRQTSDLIKMKQQLEVAELKVQQQQQSLEQAAIRTAIEKNKLTREQLRAENDLAKAIDAETKANQRAQQQLKQTNGEYKKGVQALAAVKQQLKELEFTGRTNGKLFKALSQEFTELDRRVRGAETSVGEFQRNVGNYAGAWNGLGNSINQLSREMPAFANSISTGFMAISNNLPQLFDEINKIKKANVELAKSGAPTTSAFKQVLSGIFSWQTALSVGVTLLTLYGAKMIDFIGNLFSAEAAFEDGAEAIDANTKAIERNKQALIDLQKQVDEIIKKELELDGTLSDLDLARVNAFNDYEKNLDDIQKLRKQAAEDQIKAAAQSISDEEDRVEFLAKLETTEVAGVMTVSMKKGIIRKDFSEEEIKIIQATNSKLLGLRSQYDRMEVKAAELLNEQLAAAKREFDKKAAEQEKKKREEEDKQLEEWVKKRRALIAKLYELMAETPDTDKTKFKGLQGDIQEMEDLIVKGYSRFEDAQKKAAKEFNMSQEDLMAEFYASGIEMFEDFLDQKRKLMERDKKLTKDVIQSVDKVVLNIDKIYKQRLERAEEYLNREIEANKSAIEQQARLAERGLTNTLAFEQSKAAKLQLERKRLQEQEIKQQKRVAFYNLLSGYAKTEPATALQKAILETTLAEIVAGSFIEGTENVQRDLSGNKVHNGKDGYVIAVDGDERIFNPQQNAKIGDISNDEAAQILSDYQSGKLFNYGDVTQPIINVPNQHIDLRSTNNLLLEVKKAIENKPVNHTNLSNLGDVIETQITAGVKRVLIHKRQRRI
jgi:hypothetical protein